MKNVTPSQRAALKDRAARIARLLPPLPREPSGALTPASREAFRQAAGRILRENRAVGAALVLVSGPGEEIFCFGSARLRPRLPVTEETCFRVASVSKLALSAGFLALCEAGKLSLDADLSDLLGFAVRHPRHPGIPVTPRMLLTHTASLRDEGPYAALSPESCPPLSRLLADPCCWTDDPPGSAFHYSNLSAGVAGVVMERAEGMPLDSVMRSRVFSPLGMRAAYDPRQIAPADCLADGYRVLSFPLPRLRRYDAARLAARPQEPFDPERDYFAAAGRMITDSRGMASLVRLLASLEDTPALSAASLREMRALQDGRPGIAHAGRGLGCASLAGIFPGFDPVGHQGVAYGMCSECFADPQTGCGVGLMTSGLRLDRLQEPLTQGGFDLLALGFAALRR